MIYKYPIQLYETVVRMPRGAHVLSCADQHGTICIWAAVDTKAIEVERLFLVFTTGAPLVESGLYRDAPRWTLPGEFVATVLMNGGSFVVHVFDGGEVS